MKKREYNKEFIEKIHKEEYINSLTSVKKLSDKYHINLSSRFREYGLKIFSNSEVSVRFREKKYGSKIIRDFSAIDENIAYILGLIYADGYITTVPGRLLGIKLKSSDEDILFKIKDYLSTGINIRREKNSSLLVISSQIVFDNLVKIGVKLNKTRKKMRLPLLKEEYYPHFIRGMFDGDGSVFMSDNKIHIYICSIDKTYLSQIRRILSKEDIVSIINTEKRKGKVIITPQGTAIAKFDVHKLLIRRVGQAEKFYDFIYKNCKEFFLKRKRDIFDTYFRK